MMRRVAVLAMRSAMRSVRLEVPGASLMMRFFGSPPRKSRSAGGPGTPGRVYGDYSLAALGRFISTKFSISAFSRGVMEVIETSRDDLRFGHGSAFEPCEQLANVVRRAHRHHSQTFVRPSGAVMLLFVRGGRPSGPGAVHGSV